MGEQQRTEKPSRAMIAFSHGGILYRIEGPRDSIEYLFEEHIGKETIGQKLERSMLRLDGDVKIERI